MKKTIGFILLESVLITFGVFIGFRLDRYKESVEEADQKVRLYKELIVDINKTKGDLIRLKEGGYKRLDDNLKYLMKSAASGRVSTDSFYLLLPRIERFPMMTVERATYNSIINSGRIILFEQDSIFKEVKDYYREFDFIQNNFENTQSASPSLFLTPYLNDHFDRTAIRFDSGSYVIIRPPRIDKKKFESTEFLNILWLLQQNMWHPDYVVRLINMSDKLVSHIEEHLSSEN